MPVTSYQVDAFAQKPFEGNPAGVCLLRQDRPEAWYQQVASEMNLSETAFLRPGEEGFDLRWFTPLEEVDLCGHATLASAHILWETGELGRGQEARFHTRSGLLTARLDEGRIQMDFPSEPPELCDSPAGLAEALGVQPIYVGKNRFDFLLEVESPAQVRAVSPDFTRLREIQCRGVIVTAASDDSDHDFVSRFFAPAAGVDEDPVTGSAHCCLGPYWAGKLERQRLIGLQVSRRTGRVEVEVRGDRVLLGGEAVTVLRCELLEAGESEEPNVESKENYGQRMRRQFEQWSLKIDSLASRAERHAQDGYQTVAREMGAKRQLVSERLSALESSSSEAWQDLKPGLEDAWNDLRQAVEKAASRFRS